MRTRKAQTETAETITERVRREEREAQERRLAEIRTEREARERAEAEAAERRRKAEADAKAKAEAEALRRAEQEKREMAARKERNASARKREIDRIERAYVLFERAANFLDELEKAERDGLNMGTTYQRELEKMRSPIVYSRDVARQILLNPENHFKTMRIAD